MGEIRFSEKSTRPDISYTMHQYYHLSQDPRASHRYVIIYLVKYLKATRTQGITLDTEGKKSFEVYADANFCGNWHQTTANDNPSTAKSSTGYTILYADLPTIWCIKTQTQIELSMAEVEYIALYQSVLVNHIK